MTGGGQGSVASLCTMRKHLLILRYSWSAVSLGLTALVLLALGAIGNAPARMAMVGAGSALAGAASARFIDLHKELRTEARRLEEGHTHDLDEIRRPVTWSL